MKLKFVCLPFRYLSVCVCNLFPCICISVSRYLGFRCRHTAASLLSDWEEVRLSNSEHRVAGIGFWKQILLLQPAVPAAAGSAPAAHLLNLPHFNQAFTRRLSSYRSLAPVPKCPAPSSSVSPSCAAICLELPPQPDRHRPELQVERERSISINEMHFTHTLTK